MANVSANYVVIEAGDGDELRERVKMYLQDNFLPQGGIVALGDGDYLYAQAMVFNMDHQ